MKDDAEVIKKGAIGITKLFWESKTREVDGMRKKSLGETDAHQYMSFNW